MQVIWYIFCFLQGIKKMCVSCTAPAKTNAQGYRHANYALPDTRVFVMHSTHIFSNSLLKPKNVPDCTSWFWLVWEGRMG